MSEQLGEKTEQPTQRKLEDAVKKGQFAKSAEVQTIIILMSVGLALTLTGAETWRNMVFSMSRVLGHLHDIPLSATALQGYAIQGVMIAAQSVWPVLFAAILGGLLAGGLQTRFQTASEALEVKWERLNPTEGIKRVFSFRNVVPTLIALLKLSVIVSLLYAQVRSVMADPIFYSVVDVARIAEFLADSSTKILLRIVLAMAAIASIDYAYQFWRHQQDMMMTREELKEETKNSEGNPNVRARMRRRRQSYSTRQMLLEVHKADVVVTNPTHLAVALKYDPQSMKAPRIVAKGARLNAQRIRELARQHQVPIIENKPLARMLFKHGKVGGEVPAQLYCAVAEVLAWVYRTNPYRYYMQAKQATA